MLEFPAEFFSVVMNFFSLPDSLLLTVLIEFLEAENLVQFDSSVTNKIDRPWLLAAYENKNFVIHKFDKIHCFNWFVRYKIKFGRLVFHHSGYKEKESKSPRKAYLPVRFLQQLNTTEVESIIFTDVDKTHCFKIINKCSKLTRLLFRGAWDLDDRLFKLIHVRTLKRLTHLCFSQCKVTELTIKYIADRCTDLVSFIYRSKTGGYVGNPLLDLIQRNPKLEVLTLQVTSYFDPDIQYNPNREVLLAVLTSCPNISALEVFGCKRDMFDRETGRLINRSKLQFLHLCGGGIEITMNTPLDRARVDFSSSSQDDESSMTEFLTELEFIGTFNIFMKPSDKMLLNLLTSFRVPKLVTLYGSEKVVKESLS